LIFEEDHQARETKSIITSTRAPFFGEARKLNIHECRRPNHISGPAHRLEHRIVTAFGIFHD
jgi:hypothetical protein